MMTLDLRSAAAELADAFRRRRDGGGAASDAFFFMIGAGASTPPVPLASQIEAQCRNHLSLRGEDVSRLTDLAPATPIDRYSYWLRHAYPQPVDRQELFRVLIQSQPISEANFRLAHLLSSDEAPKLVVTTNFDDFLSRALTLFGTPHVVCDHPGTAERIDPERRSEVQILHVHGTYWFYDCCNLRGEIEGRAQETIPHRTIASRLNGILFARSPIVIGYSGWEQDVFMTTLKHRLEAHALRCNIYWFCHRRDDIAEMPSFLRECEYIRFVAPPISDRARRDVPARVEDAEEDRRAHDLHKTLPPGPEAARLDAVPVLDELIRALKMPAPRLTANPIHFFAAHLRASLLSPAPSPESEQPADMYRLAPMIQRLEDLSPMWTERASSDTDLGRRLEGMRDAIRRSQYREAIIAASEVPMAELDELSLVEVRDTAYLAASQLDDASDDELAGYALTRGAAALLRFNQPDKLQENERRCLLAICATATTLRLNERTDDALALLTQAIEEYADKPYLAREFADTLDRRAYTLWEGDRLDDALTAYADIAERYRSESDGYLNHLADQAMIEQAFILNQASRFEDLLLLANEFLANHSTNGTLASDKAERMMDYKTGGLMMLRRYQEAIDVADELRATLDGSESSLDDYPWVAYRRAFCLEQLDRVEEALEGYAELASQPEPSSEWYAAQAGLRQGKLLARAEEWEKAREILLAVIQRNTGNPALAEIVAEATADLEQLA